LLPLRTELVVLLTLFRVRKHLVGFVDFLELFFRFGLAGVHVRVILARQTPVGGLDIRFLGRFIQTKRFVIILVFHTITAKFS